MLLRLQDHGRKGASGFGGLWLTHAGFSGLWLAHAGFSGLCACARWLQRTVA
jgi:hypothetical protein